MPRRSALPSYRKHKLSGQAIVTFRLPGGKRKDYLLGRFGSKEVQKANMRELLGEFQAAGGMLPSKVGEGPDLTINELLVRYLKHADEYYRARGRHADRPRDQHPRCPGSRRVDLYRPHDGSALRGTVAQEAVRDAMIRRVGSRRRTINQPRWHDATHFFRWCLSKELGAGRGPRQVGFGLGAQSWAEQGGGSPCRSRAGPTGTGRQGDVAHGLEPITPPW